MQSVSPSVVSSCSDNFAAAASLSTRWNTFRHSLKFTQTLVLVALFLSFPFSPYLSFSCTSFLSLLLLLSLCLYLSFPFSSISYSWCKHSCSQSFSVFSFSISVFISKIGYLLVSINILLFLTSVCFSIYHCLKISIYTFEF